MAAYAYKTTITPHHLLVYQSKRYCFEEQGQLNLADLSKLVGDYPFDVELDSYNRYVVEWTETRSETDEERDTRIERLEKYNTEVDRRKNLKDA